MRRAAAPAPDPDPPSAADRLAAIQQRFQRTLDEFEALSTPGVRDADSLLHATAVRNAVIGLQRLEQRIA